MRKCFSRSKMLLFFMFQIVSIFLLFDWVVAASYNPPPRIAEAIRNDVSKPLQNIRATSVLSEEDAREMLSFTIPSESKTASSALMFQEVDPVLQDRFLGSDMPGPVLNFEGINNVNGIYPPDTNGDVGRDHYIQWVNTSFAVYDKAGNCLYGPAPGNALWKDFGGVCEFTNDGDPIVLYDQLANRWLMSQMAVNLPNEGFHQCIAISETGDPLGQWYRYDFLIHENKMNDYPKFGIWPDGYYLSFNQFDFKNNYAFAGAGVVAFERDKMLQGLSARMVYFDLWNVNSDYRYLLPSDLEGFKPPPKDAPNYFAMMADNTNTVAFGTDALVLFQFHVDWTNTARSTFTGPTVIDLAAGGFSFDSNMCNYQRQCVPQPGGVPVDAISNRLMHRLTYRHFGDHESLAVNHTVDADGSDHAGIRWYEIRDPGGAPFIHQAGTYAPDRHHRWVGSIAMDTQGNMALGYSVSSSTLHPSIRYTGRLVGDPLNTLPQGEAELIAGSGYQEGSAGRWGDYSTMSVDPTDDCTFWYTQQYYNVPSVAGWQTRIGSFKFPSCGSGLRGILQGTVTNSADNPISGVLIEIGEFSTITDSNGFYQILGLPPGTYNVAASLFGYFTETADGVTITEDHSTTQDFELTLIPDHTVTGKVIDGTTGWPLYAEVSYGMGSVWTNPVTGEYRLKLPQEGQTLTVTAWISGYLPKTQVLSGLDPVVDIALDTDASACEAPGYIMKTLFHESFDSCSPPTGWTLIDNTDNHAEWMFDDPDSFGNRTGGNGCFAIADSVWVGEKETDTELLTPRIDCSRFTAVHLRFKTEFKVYKDDGIGEIADVDVSTNGGTDWTNVWQTVGADFQGTVDLDITSFAAGKSRLMVRFHYYNANDDWYWQVDDVMVYDPGDVCRPPASGGLVVGNVRDANTDKGLTGVLVSDEHGNIAKTKATPQDSHTDDGFYVLFSPTGNQTLTASFDKPYYGNDTDNVTIVTNDTVKQNFALSAGRLSIDPISLNVTIPSGQKITQDVVLSNTGGLDAYFHLAEINSSLPDFPSSGPFADHGRRVSPKHFYDEDASSVRDPTPPSASPLTGGAVIKSWETGLSGLWGITLDAGNEAWIANNGSKGDDLIYRFTAGNTNIGDTIDTSSWVALFGADMTYDPFTSMLWQVNVGGDNCIYEMDPTNKISTGNKICPYFGTSERGLAYDPTTDSFYAGSWNDGIINHFDSSGVILDSKNVRLNISGLAYNPATGHLFAMTNSSEPFNVFDVYVLDTKDNYNVIGGFNIEGFGNYEQAGLALDCNGHLWAVNKVTHTVIEADSGETGVCDWKDIPWLKESVTDGMLTTGEEQTVTFTFDATGLAEGIYENYITIAGGTPYDKTILPVKMTVLAGTGTLRFSSAAYEVSESEGSAVITVIRTGDGSKAVSVDYEANDGTATAETDYTATRGTLRWEEGDATDKTFTVPISTDNESEGAETVRLSLSNPRYTVLGSPNHATLTINDTLCKGSIYPLNRLFDSNGGTDNISVTAADDCTWTAKSNADWLTIISGQDGTGNGTVTYRAAVNTGAQFREGTLFVAGTLFSVIQDGSGYNYSIEPTEQSFPAAGGTDQVSVIAPEELTWTATSNVDWITIISGENGEGNGTVFYEVTTNDDSQAREGVLTIGSRLFKVVQEGSGACVYSLEPAGQSFIPDGGTDNVSVTAADNCSWTATSSADWITVTSGAKGKGNGTVVYEVTENTDSQFREGTLKIGNSLFTVIQNGIGCTYVIDPIEQFFPAAGGTKSSKVTTSEECGWTATSKADWITVTSGAKGSGTEIVTYKAAANTDDKPRTGTLRIGFDVLTVIQGASASSFVLDKGWNLVSFPVSSTDPAISTILSSIDESCTAMWGYRNGKWIMYDLNQMTANNLDSFDTGQGYWIHMSESETLNIEKTTDSSPVEMKKGWNLVGWKPGRTMTVEEALRSVSDKVERVWSYKNGRWRMYDPAASLLNDLDHMAPGFGYWIKVKRDCRWDMSENEDEET